MATVHGSFFSIGDISYYRPSAPLTTLPATTLTDLQSFQHDFIPATVLACRGTTLHQHELDSIYQTFSEKDDVWSRGFLSLTILLQSPDLASRRSGTQFILSINGSLPQLPQGPFLVSKATGNIFPVYRLYEDDRHAFLQGTIHKNISKKNLKAISPLALADPVRGISVPVPSRLYFPGSEDQPLAGLRFVVKDNIDLKGFHTCYGSAAYRGTYPPPRAHAPCVQILLDAGAVVVGIVKSSEFAEGTDPHEWNDWVCPFNPRGDGQQKPSSSSTGSAVATAAYEWLDFALGTDTGGSIRHPAAVNGLFGSRTSQGAIGLRGVLGATELFNTVGIFARDASTFGAVGRTLLPPKFQPFVPFAGRKYKLLYPIRAPQHEQESSLRWFPNPADMVELSAAEKQMDDFIQKLEIDLDCERVCFNLDELWQATRPKGQPESLDEAVGNIYSTLTTYFAVNTCVDQFCRDYAMQNSGEDPRITSIVKARQDHGRKMTPAQVAVALNSMQAFAEWVENVLFGAYDEEAIALLVFPQGFGIPNYRHEISERKELFNDAFSIYSFGYLVGCPDYTIPIAEVPFHSDITKRIEYLPVSVSMVARPGNDIPLFDILSSLEDKRLLSGVKTGSRMYE